MRRSVARYHAFVLIFHIPFYKNFDAETLAESYHEYFGELPEDKRPEGESAAYIIKITGNVLDKLDVLDDCITSYLKGWLIDRLPKVDLAVLRLAAYELMFERETPEGAVINEAVELAKKYGDDDSPSFVNGVLASISRDLRPDVEKAERKIIV